MWKYIDMQLNAVYRLIFPFSECSIKAGLVTMCVLWPSGHVYDGKAAMCVTESWVACSSYVAVPHSFTCLLLLYVFLWLFSVNATFGSAPWENYKRIMMLR